MNFELIHSTEELEKRFALIEDKPIIKPAHVFIFYWYKGSFRNVIQDFAPNRNLPRDRRLESLYRQKENYCGLSREEIFSAFRNRFDLVQGWYLANLKSREYFYFQNLNQLDEKLRELGQQE
jgi:hypothetical protein